MQVIQIYLQTSLYLRNKIKDKPVHTEKTTMQASTVAQVFF